MSRLVRAGLGVLCVIGCYGFAHAEVMLLSPFSKTGAVDSVAETSNQLFVVQTNLEVMAKNPPGPESFGTYTLFKIDKTTRHIDNAPITQREFFTDGGTKIFHFVEDVQKSLLFLPIHSHGMSYAMHNPLLNNVPLLIVGDAKAPVEFYANFPTLSREVQDKLVDFYDDWTKKQYKIGHELPVIDPLKVMTTVNKQRVTTWRSVVSDFREWFARKFF